jgi:hypothetical protein
MKRDFLTRGDKGVRDSRECECWDREEWREKEKERIN